MNLSKVFCLWAITGTLLFGLGQTPLEPIPLDLDKLGITLDGSRSDCNSCNVVEDPEEMGASCCDEVNHVMTCQEMETSFGWNCFGCECVDDGDSWESNYGCMNETACNYDDDVIYHYEDICIFSEENYDCNGDCAVEIDCMGVCGGLAEEDECGNCNGDGFTENCLGTDECENMDCNGDCSGTAVIDECGNCGGDGYIDICLGTDECENMDCNGECSGIAVIDDCGVCGGENTSMDSCGVCNGYGPIFTCGCFEPVEHFDCDGNCVLEYDSCGICGGNGPDFLCTDGVTIVCESLAGENCPEVGCMDEAACNYDSEANAPGECTFPEENEDCDGHCLEDLEADCNGLCGGTAEQDECGNCNGDGFTENCLGTDECENMDCNGECSGTAVIDECGVCGGDGIPVGECDCDGNVADCTGECGGSAIEDECGVCDGDGIPVGECDCDGNVEDCAGVCGGSETEDDCGICGGDSSTCTSWTELTAAGGDSQISLSWTPYGSVRGSRDVTDGCELPDMNIFLTPEGAVIYNSSENIGGFQFDVDGATPTAPTGGDAATAGMFVQAAGSTVLGFHMGGGYIPAGCGTMVNLTLDGEASGLSNIVISDALGGQIVFVYYGTIVDCMDGGDTDYTWTFGDGGDGITACNYNPEATMDEEWGALCTYPEENFDCDGNCVAELDCAGVCGGDAEVDECGVCNGSGGTEACGCEGIPDGDCDCDGNVLDCAGNCGGTAVIDACGVCGGNGADINCWDGSTVCDAGDCPEEPQSVTYSVYRDGDLLISGLENPSYTDTGLGYAESHCYTVTYTLNEVESSQSGEACAVTDEMSQVEGCMDPQACNYDPDAVIDDGNCEYAEYECWNGEVVCESGDCPFEPGTDPFSFNQSSSQAFYHIVDAYDLNGDPLVAGEDWIAVFKDDLCVGARLWTEDATTDIPAMGDDGFSYSEGYLSEGELPSFKIFDASENLVIDAFLSDQYKFYNNQVYLVNTMKGGIGYNLPLNNYHNLVSFYVLPDDVSPGGITFGISDIVHSLISEGESAINVNGEWSGSLTEFASEKGYWISIDSPGAALFGAGLSHDPTRVYDLHEGPNLISYPDTGMVDLSAAIPDEVEESFIAILSEGKAAYNTEDGWVGTLTTFQGGSGYWVITDSEVSFSYIISDNMARIQLPPKEVLPDDVGFKVHQSPLQAFYFIENITLDEGGIEVGDWILAYNGEVLAGIRQWYGEMVDIPVMGSYGDQLTAGYFADREIPSFKILKKSSGKLIPLDGGVPGWSSNGIFMVNTLYEAQEIPEEFGLNEVYPNPFNPVTSIQFSIAEKSSVSVQIFDMQGRIVDTIVSDVEFKAGYHQVQWNAEDNSTGIYIVKLSAGANISTRKLMLIK